MGRHPKFARGELVGAALRLVAGGGPRAVTVAAISRESGAPTGSIYHRYPSREHLLAELWMDVVEGFQAELVAHLDAARDVAGAAAAARLMAAWTREHVAEARLLLLHRRQDFVPGAWPPTLVERAAALEPRLGAALRDLARRLYGGVDGPLLARLRFALLDAPLGGVKPYVQAGKPAPPQLDELIAELVHALLGASRSPALAPGDRPSRSRSRHR